MLTSEFAYYVKVHTEHESCFKKAHVKRTVSPAKVGQSSPEDSVLRIVVRVFT